MDRASPTLAQNLDSNVRKTYAEVADRSEVPLTTVWYRAHGRPSIEEKAQGQQYLTPEEEIALIDFLLRMSDLGRPVRVKFLPSLAFSIARQRAATDRSIKPPNKNWPQAFKKRHPDLEAKRVKAMDWRRHDKHIHEKITHWFEVIGKELRRLDILPGNVYNMDETGVMLSMQGSAKVLVGKNDRRDYRGARVKCTMVTAIEWVSAAGESLKRMVIWPATTHQNNWTTFETPGWYYGCSENGYNTSKISLEWFKRVYDPQTRERANRKPRLLISDGFGTHETLAILEFCFENNIILARLLSHTSHKLQLCDVAVFAPLKTAYCDQADQLE